MAECLKNGKACPAFYECKQERLAALEDRIEREREERDEEYD